MWRPLRPAKTPLEAVRVKDTKEAAAGKVWQPRQPANTTLEAVGVKDIEGVATGKILQPRRPAKAPLQATGVKDTEGVAVGKMLRQRRTAKVLLEAVGDKDTKGVALGTMLRPRQPAKAPLETVGVKGTEGVIVGKMVWPRRPAKAPLQAVRVKDTKGVAVGKMLRPRLPARPALETVGVKGTEGFAQGKMWRPRLPAKASLETVGVKAADGTAMIAVDREVKVSMLEVPMVAAADGGEKGPMEEDIALDGAPFIATNKKGKVSIQEDPVVSAIHREVEASVLGGLVVATAGGGEEGPLEDRSSLDGAPFIATYGKGKVLVQGDPMVSTVDGEVEALVLGVPMVAAAMGGDKALLENGISLDGTPVIATVGKGDVSVQGDPVVHAVNRDVEALVPGVLPVAAMDGGGNGPLEDGIALDGVPVIANGKGEVSVQGDPVVHVVDGEVEASVLEFPVVGTTRCGEKRPLEDGISQDGAPVIATDRKGEVSVQGDPLVPIVDQKGNGKEKDVEGIKWLKHYSSVQNILIIGDGDLSFSLALATAFGSGENLVATSLDSYETLTSKYGKAESNVIELKRLGATVLHGVDAKTMKLHSYLKMRQFDRVVFNFPHSGFNGKEDHLHVINAHKQLVHGFFANARHLLGPYGETHISHKIGFPYDAWDIEKLAYESCLIMVRKVIFSKEDYPGYNQKRGDSATCDQPFALGPCCTYMFCIGDVKKLKQGHGNMACSISYIGDNRFYPGISATYMSPIDLHPVAPAWPQPYFDPVNKVHMPIAFDRYPFGVAETEHPVNCYGTCFQHQDILQSMCRGPPLDVLPSQGGFHPPMMRIPSTTFLAHWEQPWYQEGPPTEPQWRGNYPYSPQEHQSLQMEYDIHKQQTLFLEQRYMESVEKQARLEMLIQVYGTR